ncbi:MAG: hypothetical protein COA91_06710 [Robiginitomaculum sp.]|nr:MAG: hypothetical protein COA91_06710 [Robiginitomaculum sp.]
MRAALLIIVLSFAAGVVGILLGHKYIMPDAVRSIGLHEQIHAELVLNKAQDEKLHVLETGFSENKAVLEARMKAASAELSRAMQEAHTMAPNVIAAKDKYVQVLDEMQTLTIAHIFAMRALLDQGQAEQFDKIVQRSFQNMAN